MKAKLSRPDLSARFTGFEVKRTAAGVVNHIIPNPKRFAFHPAQGPREWFLTAEEAVAALDEATEQTAKTEGAK